VEDTLDALPDGTYLTLMTADEPVVQGNTLRIGGMLLTAESLGEEGIMVETCPLSDALLRESWQRDALYRVKLFPAGPRLAFSARPLK